MQMPEFTQQKCQGKFCIAVAQACLILEVLVHKREKKAAPKVAARVALQKEKKEGNEHSGGAGCTCTGDGAEEEKGKGAAFD